MFSIAFFHFSFCFVIPRSSSSIILFFIACATFPSCCSWQQYACLFLLSTSYGYVTLRYVICVISFFRFIDSPRTSNQLMCLISSASPASCLSCRYRSAPTEKLAPVFEPWVLFVLKVFEHRMGPCIVSGCLLELPLRRWELGASKEIGVLCDWSLVADSLSRPF